MHLRHATDADLPRIVEIYNQSIPGGWSTADTQPVTVEARMPWFRSHDPQRRPIWVCEVDGEIGGWVSLEWFYAGRPAYDKTAEISFYVATAYHGQGIGTFILKEAIAQCPSLGITSLIAMHFDHNQPSAKVTNRLGFEPVGHLERIAEIDGEKRGLVIRLLRIAPHC
jgi:phosphinothricin acetyltransferase